MTHVGIHLSSGILNEIIRIGELRYPVEACGVLLPTPRWKGFPEYSQVVELPNRSMAGHDSYVIWPSDVKEAIASWAERQPEEELNKLAIWHTHPGGGVGPSPGDLKNRIPDAAYLVVALDQGTGKGTPCWF